jgi:lysyl-tRNA synthetase class II
MVDLVLQRTTQLKAPWNFDEGSLSEKAPLIVDYLVYLRTNKMSDSLKEILRKLSQGEDVRDGYSTELDEFRTNASTAVILERMRGQIRSLTREEQLVEVYEKLVEPLLIDPVFVTRIPSVIIPLAKKCADDKRFADVYELAINGQEISPGYSELNDPDVQAANFAHQVGDEAEKQKTDEDFLTALKYGMPPAGGLGLGIDRLVMMLTGAESIRDVILFPLMRPQNQG